jgi:hypothetical protein
MERALQSAHILLVHNHGVTGIGVLACVFR